MKNTDEMFNEFDVEDVGEMKETKAPEPAPKPVAKPSPVTKPSPRAVANPEPKPAPMPEPSKEKKTKNPVRFFVTFFGLLLLCLLLALAGTKIWRDYFDKEDEPVTAQQTPEDAQALEAEEKKREEELKERLKQEYDLGVSEGEKAVLDLIRESIENGTSVVETLRKFYPDRLVVASGGNYLFIPVLDSLKKNDYVAERLVTLDSGELQYLTDGAVSSYKGIDVSKFQGNIDGQKVAQDGVSFAFIRVGYRGYGEKGVLVEDPNAKDNLTGAHDAGIKTGVYFYTQAITELEAREEVNMLLDIIRPYRIDCPVVIDVERVSSSGARMNQLDVQTRTQIVKVFCEAVKEAGYRPMIYHNLEMAAVMLDVSQLEDYDKWFAYYKTELYYPYAYKLWQYSDKGRVQGISGDVDVNIAFEPLWE